MNALHFEIPGEPVPKGRARSHVMHTRAGKAYVQHYTPKATKAYELAAALCCRAAVERAKWLFTPKDRFTVVVKIYRTHECAGGDLDNYVKAVCDAINGIAFGDDRYVRGLLATLRRDPERPRVEVEVRRHRRGERARA